MQNDDELLVQIMNDSKKKLLRLKVLSNFFNHPDFISILIRTKIIHYLFENNKSLDANKLELFHLQYTVTLIDLFNKLKKNKEQQYLLLSDEIYINDEFISTIAETIDSEDFSIRVANHSKMMSQKIEKLYNMFVINDKNRFDWSEIVKFSTNFKGQYYREIPQEKYEELICFDRDMYENNYSKFEKKLLGRLNILKFKVKFLCGLVCKNEFIEVFEFRDSNDLFFFVGNNKSFFFLNKEDRKELNISKNGSHKNQIVEELKEKNKALNKKLTTIKTELTNDVQVVLKEYLEKISSVDFLDELQNVDEQTNILKAMLNIKIN